MNVTVATIATTLAPSPEDMNTTLIIGFCALVLFVVAGVAGSVLLCISLKRDSFLWDNVTSDSEKQEHSSNNKQTSCSATSS
jgi:hypothetical protein